MQSEYTYRKTTLADIDLLIKLRIDFINDEGIVMTTDETDSLIITCRNYFEKAIQNNSFIAFIAEYDGETIYNVFTYSKYRRQGIATNVLKLLLEETKSKGAGFVDLLATGDGKPVYEKLGFCSIDMVSMRKELE